MKFLVLAAVAMALFFAFKGTTIRKDLVSDRVTIEADWAEVDAALGRRAALVPELIDVVRAEAPGEAVAMQAAGDARTSLTAAHTQREKILANARIDEALARLMLAVESHPKLEESQKYGDLLEALKGAEYQIAVARRKYNEAVEHYNARIEVFPNNVVASVTRLGKIDAYFQTPAI